MKYLRFIISTLLIIASLNIFATNDVLTDTLPEVIVTHNREQLLQASHSNTPSTFYISRIEQQQIQSAKDFSTFVPSLHIPEYGSAMTSSIYMRGLGARIDNPVVGLYIDGIGIANKNSYDFTFLDIRSAEIYRGPQGTLFGRNTIGGIINIKTISPLAYQGTRARVSYANQNTAVAQLSHYKKINDRLGIAVGARYDHTDGFFKNAFDNKLTDWAHQAGAIMKIEARPNDKINIINNLTYNFVKQGAFPYHLQNQPVNHNDYCGYQRHNINEGLSIEIQLDKLILNSTTSYQYLNDIMDMDQDYLPYPYFTLRQHQHEHFAEQNITIRNKYNIASSFRWDWLTGLSLNVKHNRMSAPVTFLRDGIDSIILANANVFGDIAAYQIEEQQFVINSQFNTVNTNAALYHTSYLTWNKWQLELGLRIDYEYSKFNYDSNGHFHYNFKPYIIDYRLLESTLKGTSKLNYLEFLPRIAASYKLTNWKFFLSLAEGYKAGGFNTQLFSDIVRNQMMQQMMQRNPDSDIEKTITYQPERCLTSEAGVEYNYRTTDWHINSELRIYDNELFNQQLTVFPTNTTGRMMTNAGRSRSCGIELTADAHYKGFSANIAYSYTHARFREYKSGTNDYKGNHIPYIPDHTLAIGLAYRFNIEHNIVNSLTIAAQSKTIGEIYWDNANIHRQPIYNLLNAKITLAMQYVSLSIWGQNLLNTQYNVFYFESLNNIFMQSGRPVTYGAAISIEI